MRESSMGSQARAELLRVADPAETSEGLLALRRVLQRDVAYEKMAIMMENLQREMRELRQVAAPSPEKTITNTRTQAEDEELQALRAENQALKKVLKTLPAQTQFENPQYSQSHDGAFGTPESTSTNALGKRKRGSQIAADGLFYEDDSIAGGYHDFDEPANEVSGLASLEHDAAQGYSVWQGEEEGSEGDDYSEDNEDKNQDKDPSRSVDEDRAPSDTATGERHSARSRERRQTLPADFIAEEQRYLLSDSNDENFDPHDPKIKGRKHKRTRSAERRRRERLEHQQDSLWKKGVPGGGYENGDGWVEQKRHHSGRFGRKAAVGDGLAVYPKYVNEKLFANGRQIPTTHKRLARELVYLGLDDWIDKDKSDPLYRRTIRVARKHYAYHHGGISSKALCQGKYTRKDLEQVGMWDDELFEEINLGEESDVEKLDFPLDPALQNSIEKWKKEGVQAKERKRKAAREAAATFAAGDGDLSNDRDESNSQEEDTGDTAQQSRIFDLTEMTEFSDEDAIAQEPGQQSVPQVAHRVEKHKKFDSIWQAPVSASDNPVLSIIQHAEARIKAAEEEMGEPTFKSKKAQKFKTIDPFADTFSAILSRVPSDAYITPANNKGNRGTRRKAPSADTIQTAAKERPTIGRASNTAAHGRERNDATTKGANKPTGKNKGFKGTLMRTVAEHLELLDLSSKKESNSFLRELRAYFAINKDTGAQLSVQQHISLTDEQLMDYAERFLETSVVLVGGSRKIGLEFWPDDGSAKLSYVADREEIKKHVYDIFVIQRFNKARNLRHQLNKTLDENVSISQVLNPAFTRPGLAAGMSPSPLSSTKRAMLPAPLPLLDRPFEDGLRYNVKPGFRGNKYYYEDGVPRTAEDAARLERKLKYKNRTRMSLPTGGLSDDLVLERDRSRRKATILNMSTNGDIAADSSLMTPSAREASVLGDSVMQMASAMKQLTRVFDDTVESMDADSDTIDDNKDIVEQMDVDVAAKDSPAAHESVTGQAKPTVAVDLVNATIPSDTDMVLGFTTDPNTSDDIPILAGSGREVAETTTKSVEKSLELETATKMPIVPTILTRSATQAATTAKPASGLTETKRSLRKPISPIFGQCSPTSLSDKENALPRPETDPSSVPEEMQHPAKKVKTILKRGPGRPPRKSAAELDQLAKETMERETRSSARKSRSGMYFDSRNSL